MGMVSFGCPRCGHVHSLDYDSVEEGSLTPCPCGTNIMWRYDDARVLLPEGVAICDAPARSKLGRNPSENVG